MKACCTCCIRTRSPTWAGTTRYSPSPPRSRARVSCWAFAVTQAGGDGGFWKKLRRSKDPGAFTVVAEDSAALAGLLIAALGIYASERLDMPGLDGLASVFVGLLLCGVAALLIIKSRELLVGTGVTDATRSEIRRLTLGDRAVSAVSSPLTMYLGPDSVLLVLDVRFRDDVEGTEIAAAIKRVEQAIQQRFPLIERIYVEAVDRKAQGLSRSE